MIEYRDRLVKEWGLQLVVGKNEAVLQRRHLSQRARHARRMLRHAQKGRLKAVLDKHHYTGVIVGVRRDEEPTRAKERYFSPRDKNMEWNVEDQPPELWDQFKTDFEKGTHIRIHPLLHWTELNIWEYIERENIPVIPLYFDNGKGERYRSLGCAPALSHQIQRPHRARNHRGIAPHQDLRAFRPRPGQGERRRLREIAPRRLYVSRSFHCTLTDAQ
jgi:sulfate adenylyltransferase subunit 2